MEKILDIITEKMERAFADAGYDASYGRVTVSNRPDLCEYPCIAALAAAKQYHCAPIQIAKAVAEKLDAADYSTEMKCHRHPYQKGVPARKGIEY